MPKIRYFIAKGGGQGKVEKNLIWLNWVFGVDRTELYQIWGSTSRQLSMLPVNVLNFKCVA